MGLLLNSLVVDMALQLLAAAAVTTSQAVGLLLGSYKKRDTHNDQHKTEGVSIKNSIKTHAIQISTARVR